MFLLAQTTHRMVIRHDPAVGHLYVPNIRARIPHERGAFYVVTNSAGFRSDVEFVRERSRRPRILFFGDSFTAGDGCSNDERFAELVATALGADVYNYAVSGTGTDQQLLIYERFARDVPADLIVLCVYVENIERNKVAFRESIDRFSKNRVLIPKPYFSLDGGTLALHHVPVPIDRPRLEDTDRPRAQRLDRERDDPLQALVYKPLRRLKGNEYLDRVRAGVKQRLPWLMPAVLRRTGFQPYEDYRSTDSEGWRVMRAIVARFIESAAPTPVLIVPVPDYYFYHDGIEPLYQPLFDQFADQRRGVHVIDVTRPLYELPWADKKRIAFRHDTHFSPFGHEQVARVIAGGIRSRGLVPNTTRIKTGRAFASGRARDTYVLGISAFYHDSAAALIRDGEIVAAAEEERFSRVKNDRRFPAQAANYCLEEAGIDSRDLAAVVFYDNAPLTFERLLHSLAATGAGGADAWRRIVPGWLRHKLHIPQIVRQALAYDGVVLHDAHHRSHAASAFYASPFRRAAILTLDGVGEWATGSIGVGVDAQVTLVKEMRFPNSLGLLYSAFTQFTGFAVNSGEYKLMGLAPYGEPRYVDTILRHLVDLKDDGSLELDMEYFAFLSELSMTNERFARLFGGPARSPGDPLTEREMDLARSIQVVTEEAVLRAARHAHALTGERLLCMAGGVALNCVANGRVLREGPFDDVWIQPAAGDAGGALGAALDVYHSYFGRSRAAASNGRSLQGGSFLGPAFSDAEIRAFLTSHGYPHTAMDPAERGDTIARRLAGGEVVGHVAGRLEFGPRSLGARAILADARNEEMQQTLNLKIKYRESFRPFAPSVLAERASDYFDLDRESPYMLVAAPVKASRRKPFTRTGSDLAAAVARPRSDIPAVTHVDYSARVQTVVREDHPQFRDVIEAFERLTGCGVIVNTSFNVRGEPIVCTPDDAYRCFMRTHMDVLVLGNFILEKAQQPPWAGDMGHVEVDDEVRSDRDAEFEDAVAGAFLSDFLPAVTGLPGGSVRVRTAPHRSSSAWEAVTGADAGPAMFIIPPALDSSTPDPAEMADAITAYWQPGAATDALRRVLARLLDINRRFPAPAGGPDESVSNAAYVMY